MKTNDQSSFRNGFRCFMCSQVKQSQYFIVHQTNVSSNLYYQIHQGSLVDVLNAMGADFFQTAFLGASEGVKKDYLCISLFLSFTPATSQFPWAVPLVVKS